MDKPIEIHGFSCPFKVLLLSDVLAGNQYLLPFNLVQLVMEYVRNKLMLKFELKVIEGTAERKECGVYIFIKFEVKYLLYEHLTQLLVPVIVTGG